MGQFNLTEDSQVTDRILNSGKEQGTFHFSTGYFNITDDYSKSIVDNSNVNFNLLMAHPTANGFLGASGIIGAIPFAYSFIAETFWKNVVERRSEHRIKMYEYQKEALNGCGGLQGPGPAQRQTEFRDPNLILPKKVCIWKD